jgi:hypothetical protein
VFFEVFLPIYITQQYTCYITDSYGKTLDLSEIVCGIKPPRKTCADYATGEEAQQAFDAQLSGTQYLDGDGDGSVCEWGTKKEVKNNE